MDSVFSLLSSVRGWFGRRRLFFKIIGVAVIGLLLFIPLGMVKSTLNERQQRYREAVEDVTHTWGGAQRIAGPVLIVPYTYKMDRPQVVPTGQRDADKRLTETVRGEAYFLPDDVTVGGTLTPSLRKRGIYTTPVYAAQLSLKGQFAAPHFDFIGERDVQPQWDQARVSFVISDLRGTQENLVLKWGDDAVPLQPGARFSNLGTGVHTPVKLAAGEARAFSLELALNGSDALKFVPLGRQTAVRLASTWTAPSFGGAYLPVERKVGPEGFEATWKVSYYGRNFPQQWALGASDQPSVDEFEVSAFGVSLLQPVNAYRTVERAIKYGVLFITLVFTTFFLFEALSGLRLNALNYLLVGAALCLFYLGLLALAEFLVFGAAYALAAGASTLLIALYARRVLQGGQRAWWVAALLGGVYGYLYFVLQMEDFSLLAGTGALFAVLAAIMYVTRSANARGTENPTNDPASGSADDELSTHSDQD